MSISMFFKKRRKKLLRKRIYNLRQQAVKLSSYAKSSKEKADEAIELLKKYEASKTSYDVVELCHTIDDFETFYFIYNEKYLNTIDEIKSLIKELNSL